MVILGELRGTGRPCVDVDSGLSSVVDTDSGRASRLINVLFEPTLGLKHVVGPALGQ